MADLRYKDGALVDLLSTGLNSFANNARVVSDVVVNATALNLYADFELVVAYATAPATGKKIGELYILPTVDLTNFASGSDTVNPQRALLVGVFETVAPSTSTPERLVLPAITLPPRNFKVLFKNTSGFNLAATNNTLKMRGYKLESV